MRTTDLQTRLDAAEEHVQDAASLPDVAPPNGYPLSSWAGTGEPFHVRAELRAAYVEAAAAGHGSPAAYTRWARTLSSTADDDELAYEKWAHDTRLMQAKAAKGAMDQLADIEARKVPCPTCGDLVQPGTIKVVPRGGANDYAGGFLGSGAPTGPNLRACRSCMPEVAREVGAGDVTDDGRLRRDAVREYVQRELGRQPIEDGSDRA